MIASRPHGPGWDRTFRRRSAALMAVAVLTMARLGEAASAAGGGDGGMVGVTGAAAGEAKARGGATAAGGAQAAEVAGAGGANGDAGVTIAVEQAADRGGGAGGHAGAAAPGHASDRASDVGHGGSGDASASRQAAGGAPGLAPPPPPSPPPPEIQLRVRVLEKGTRRPLGGASISIDARSVGETDVDGSLVVSLPPGSHQVEAQYPGHAASRDAVEIAVGREDELTARLEPQAEGERYETQVRSVRKEVAGVTVDAREAKQTAGTSGDPIRVIASLPGVSQVVWPAAIFVVRGSNPGNTGFFIDGIRVPATFHLALGPSIIAPDLLGAMDFYPGAYPANFGRYIAGVVSIHTERPPEDRPHVLADVSFYESRAVVTAPVDDGRGVVAAAARYSYTGPLLSLFDQNTTINYSDYQLRFDHRLLGGQATVFAFGSFDRLDWTSEPLQTSASSSAVTQTAALQFHRLDLRWVGAVLGGRLTVGVTGGYDQARSTLSQAPLSVDSESVAPRLLWTRRLGSAFDLEAGADAEYQHFKAQPLQFGGKLSDLGRSRPALSQGTFLAVRFHPTERLIVAPGVRGNLFMEEGISRFVIEPRLDARVELSEHFGLKLNLGRFSQMPSLPLNVAGFESFGLASIGLQRSDAISGGVTARALGDNTLDVIGFYQRMRVTDVGQLDLQTGKITGEDYLVLHDGVGYGVETMLRRPASHRFNGWVSYTLSYSLRNGANGVVRSDWDQRHILNLVAAFRATGTNTLSTRFHFSTGREVAVPPRTNRVQLPSYYQIDVRAEHNFVFNRFILDLFVDVANVTYNRELIQYVVTTTGPQPSYLRIVLPTVGLHGAF